MYVIFAAFAFGSGGFNQGYFFPKCFWRNSWPAALRRISGNYIVKIRVAETDSSLCTVASCGVSSIDPLFSNATVVDKPSIL
jgi:hypothetical protein